MLRWTHEDRPIANGAGFAIEQQTQVEGSHGVVVTRSRLNFTAHSTRFSGRYKCRASGNTLHEQEYHLQVQGMCTQCSVNTSCVAPPAVPAEIMLAPVGPGHGVASSVILSCVTYGMPTPTVTWKYGTSIVSDALVTSHTQQQQYSGVAVVSSTLELCPMQEHARSGEYSCEVDNGVGVSTVKSSPFHLCFIS